MLSGGMWEGKGCGISRPATSTYLARPLKVADVGGSQMGLLGLKKLGSYRIARNFGGAKILVN